MESTRGQLISVGIFRLKFAVPFLSNWFFAELGNSVKEFKLTRVIPTGRPGLIGKCRSIFISDRSVWLRHVSRKSLSPRTVRLACVASTVASLSPTGQWITSDQKRTGSVFKMAADFSEVLLCANCGRKQRFMKLCTACRKVFYW